MSPLQEPWGNFTGLLVHVSTAGTSPEGPFTGTFMGPQSLLQGRYLDRPQKTRRLSKPRVGFDTEPNRKGALT